MRPLGFPLLADENIHPDVIMFLRENGCDIESIFDKSMQGATDRQILSYAYDTGKVVLTHDNDFGGLIIFQEQPYIGVIYLRPGHIQANFTIETLQAIQTKPIEVNPPFILVAEHSGNTIRMHIRHSISREESATLRK